MPKAPSKKTPRKSIESAIDHLVQEQQAYYEGWLTALIAQQAAKLSSEGEKRQRKAGSGAAGAVSRYSDR